MRRKNRKSSMSINMLVIMALALAALIIAVVIMNGKSKIFSRSLADCVDKGGECIAKNAVCDGTISMFSCNNGEKCCMSQQCSGAGLSCREPSSCSFTNRVSMLKCPAGEVCCKS